MKNSEQLRLSDIRLDIENDNDENPESSIKDKIESDQTKNVQDCNFVELSSI